MLYVRKRKSCNKQNKNESTTTLNLGHILTLVAFFHCGSCELCSHHICCCRDLGKVTPANQHIKDKLLHAYSKVLLVKKTNRFLSLIRSLTNCDTQDWVPLFDELGKQCWVRDSIIYFSKRPFKLSKKTHQCNINDFNLFAQRWKHTLT